MALIPCYECEKEISDKAPACPHCGAPKGEGAPEASRPSATSLAFLNALSVQGMVPNSEPRKIDEKFVRKAGGHFGHYAEEKFQSWPPELRDSAFWRHLGFVELPSLPPVYRGLLDKFRDHSQADFLMRESTIFWMASTENDVFVGARLLTQDWTISSRAFLDYRSGNVVASATTSRRIGDGATLEVDGRLFSGDPTDEPVFAR